MSKRVYGWAAEERPCQERETELMSCIYRASRDGDRATAYGPRSEREDVQHADNDDDTQRVPHGEHEGG